MPEDNLEKQLRSLPLRTMREEFKHTLKSHLKQELEASKPSPPVFVLNRLAYVNAVLILLVIVLFVCQGINSPASSYNVTVASTTSEKYAGINDISSVVSPRYFSLVNFEDGSARADETRTIIFKEVGL